MLDATKLKDFFNNQSVIMIFLLTDGGGKILAFNILQKGIKKNEAHRGEQDGRIQDS